MHEMHEPLSVNAFSPWKPEVANPRADLTGVEVEQYRPVDWAVVLSPLPTWNSASSVLAALVGFVVALDAFMFVRPNVIASISAENHNSASHGKTRDDRTS